MMLLAACVLAFSCNHSAVKRVVSSVVYTDLVAATHIWTFVLVEAQRSRIGALRVGTAVLPRQAAQRKMTSLLIPCPAPYHARRFIGEFPLMIRGGGVYRLFRGLSHSGNLACGLLCASDQDAVGPGVGRHPHLPLGKNEDHMPAVSHDSPALNRSRCP